MITTAAMFRVAVIALAVAACGKGKESTPQAGSDTPKPADPAAKGSADSKPTKVEPAAPKFPMPADVSADKPLSVPQVDAIAKAWPAKKEITFIGYPAFFLGDSGQLNMGLKLAAEAAQKDDKAVVYCSKMADSEKEKKVDNKTPVTVRGKFRGKWSDKLVSFDDCVVTATGTAANPEAALGGAEPVGVDKLAAGYLGWFGKEISVVGYYGGQTISRKLPKDGGAIIDVRIDLLVEGGKFDRKVGCHLPLEEPDEAMTKTLEKNRPQLNVKGTIKEIVFGSVQLDPCTVTSK